MYQICAGTLQPLVEKFFASSTNHRFIELQARAIFIFEQSQLEVCYELFAGKLHSKYEF